MGGKLRREQIIKKLISIGVCAEKHFTSEFDHETDIPISEVLISMFETRSVQQTTDQNVSQARQYCKANLISKHECFICGKKPKKIKILYSMSKCLLLW